MDDYENKYKDYKFKINWTSSEPFDPMKDAVEVRLTTRDGEEYYANFVTTRFIDYLFKKNKETGECANGSYFCMPNMILVEEISKKNIKAAIDDLIEKLAIEMYFEKLD